MKKYLAIICLGLLLFATGCTNNKEEKKVSADAIKFKEEYESLNGKTREKDGNTIRSIKIPKDNPMVYIAAEDLVKKIDDKESFIVYFGFSDCPWCRSVVSTLIEVAKENKTKKIYYVDVKNIRDTMVLEKDKIAVTDEEGSQGYYDILERFDNVLSDYTLKNSKGKTVKTGEKRIYAPNVVAVVDGKAVKLTEGNSDKQDDPYMELTDEMIEETKDKFSCIFKCFSKNSKVCQKDSRC